MTTTTANISTSAKLAMLIAAAKARQEVAKQELLIKEQEFLTTNTLALHVVTGDTDGMTAAQLAERSEALPTTPLIPNEGMTYNSKQQEAITNALEGKNFCLIGAAGTGKTTAVRELCKQLVLNNKVPLLTEGTKVLEVGSPGIVCCSFTNVAVINIARNMQGAVPCRTIHALLEFRPVLYEIIAEDGSVKNTVRFEPSRTRFNPLPAALTVIIIEEASMVGTELFALLLDALPFPEDIQFIILGDINQLPPVYDTAILGYKMLELPIVELVEVYRQALNSPIITLAHKIKDGVQMCEAELRSPICNVDAGAAGKLTIKPWKKRLDSFNATKIAADFVKAAIDCLEFDPDKDMVLIPFNKEFGTLEFNKYVAQHLGTKRGAVVYEVIAGFNKHHVAVGDKVLVNKRFGIITKIVRNGSYYGIHAQEPSIHLNRWGYNTDTSMKKLDSSTAIEDIDSLLAAIEEVEDRKNQASHFIDVRLEGRTEDETLTTSAEVNGMLFSYALTVHKAQGSEWRKVYCLFHHSHNVMMCRELLYTAVTRAREELVVICEPNHFQKVVETQRIKGATLAEKAVYFQGRISAKESESKLIEVQ